MLNRLPVLVIVLLLLVCGCKKKTIIYPPGERPPGSIYSVSTNLRFPPPASVREAPPANPPITQATFKGARKLLMGTYEDFRTLFGSPGIRVMEKMRYSSSSQFVYIWKNSDTSYVQVTFLMTNKGRLAQVKAYNLP